MGGGPPPGSTNERKRTAGEEQARENSKRHRGGGSVDVSGNPEAGAGNRELLATLMSTAGATVDGFELTSGSCGDRVTAGRALPAGHCLVKLPADAVVTVTAALASPLGAAVCAQKRVVANIRSARGEDEEGTPAVTGRSVLYLYLIWLRFFSEEHDAQDIDDKGRAVARAYAISLPSFIGTPLTWTAAELALQQQSFQEEIAGLLPHLRSQYSLLFDRKDGESEPELPLVDGLQRLLGDKFALNIRGSDTPSCWQAWLWAHSVFGSRNFVSAQVEKLAVELHTTVPTLCSLLDSIADVSMQNGFRLSAFR